jgi:glycosyltransferase involved in cell wall biosynthesis
MFESLGGGKPILGSMVVDEPAIITLDDYGFVVVPANPTDLAEKY